MLVSWHAPLKLRAAFVLVSFVPFAFILASAHRCRQASSMGEFIPVPCLLYQSSLTHCFPFAHWRACHRANTVNFHRNPVLSMSKNILSINMGMLAKVPKLQLQGVAPMTMNHQGQPMYQQGQPMYQQGQPQYQQGQPQYQQGQPMYQQGQPMYQQAPPQYVQGEVVQGPPQFTAQHPPPDYYHQQTPPMAHAVVYGGGSPVVSAHNIIYLTCLSLSGSPSSPPSSGKYVEEDAPPPSPSASNPNYYEEAPRPASTTTERVGRVIKRKRVWVSG